MGLKTEQIFKRAKTNLDNEDHENALRLFNEVLNREPRHQEALRNKGYIKIINGSKEAAEEFLLFAIEQQPEDDQLYQMLGTLYHNTDDPQKAVAQFNKAVELNSDNGTAHQGLGMIYAQIYGDHEQAVDHFSRAIESGINDAEVFFYRGCSHIIMDHMQKAEEDLHKAGELGHTKSEEMLEKYF